MSKKIVGILGLIIFIIGVYVWITIYKSEQLAKALDQTKTTHGFIDGPPPCTWETTAPEPVMSENTSQAIQIKTANSIDVACETTLSLGAPGFDKSPDKEEQKIVLEKGAIGSLSWILTPQNTGTYEITVSDMLNTKIYGITVTNVLGLSPIQAKVLSGVGSLFGPMFTIPWWWDRIRRKKDIKEENKTK